MRKPFATVAAVLVVTVGAACGASGGQDESTGTTTTTTTRARASTTTTKVDTTTTTSPSGRATAVDAWAASFCRAFDGWLAEISKASTNVGEGISGGDIEAGKAAIVNLFETASVATEEFVSSIRKGGIPDIADGDRFIDDLVGRFDAFNQAIESAKADAVAVPTSDTKAFGTEVGALVKTFQKETAKVGTSFSELDSKYPSQDLQSALTSSCKSFGGVRPR